MQSLLVQSGHDGWSMTQAKEIELIYRKFVHTSIGDVMFIEEVARDDAGRQAILACALRYLDECLAAAFVDPEDLEFQGNRLALLRIPNVKGALTAWTLAHDAPEKAQEYASVILNSHEKFLNLNPDYVPDAHNIPVVDLEKNETDDPEILKNTF